MAIKKLMEEQSSGTPSPEVLASLRQASRAMGEAGQLGSCTGLRTCERALPSCSALLQTLQWLPAWRRLCLILHGQPVCFFCGSLPFTTLFSALQEASLMLNLKNHPNVVRSLRL